MLRKFSLPCLRGLPPSSPLLLSRNYLLHYKKNLVKRQNHHTDLRSAFLSKKNETKYLFQEGFKIKSFQFTYPPPNCEIEIDEIEQLTQGLHCRFLSSNPHSYPSKLEITYQRPATVLQDLHNEKPPEHTIQYQWNTQQQDWTKLSHRQTYIHNDSNDSNQSNDSN